ncbi:hypothetical protein ACFYY3_11545 [Streptomyces sp. NPDC001812]|uniref:hypothetical protein n=1 Tax=Streptomyces sp. NPDC001812 TaxID=3364611 RepID=UPI00367DAC21
MSRRAPPPAPRTEFTGAPLLAGDEPRSGGAVGRSLPAPISTSPRGPRGRGRPGTRLRYGRAFPVAGLTILAGTFMVALLPGQQRAASE